MPSVTYTSGPLRCHQAGSGCAGLRSARKRFTDACSFSDASNDLRKERERRLAQHAFARLVARQADASPLRVHRRRGIRHHRALDASHHDRDARARDASFSLASTAAYSCDSRTTIDGSIVRSSRAARGNACFAQTPAKISLITIRLVSSGGTSRSFAQIGRRPSSPGCPNGKNSAPCSRRVRRDPPAPIRRLRCPPRDTLR